MPLPLTISCSSKYRLVLPFWCHLTRVVSDIVQEGRKMVVCMCLEVFEHFFNQIHTHLLLSAITCRHSNSRLYLVNFVYNVMPCYVWMHKTSYICEYNHQMFRSCSSLYTESDMCCRVGGRENFFHCLKCDLCLGINLKDSHKVCVERRC